MYSLVPEEAKPVLLVHELGLRASCYVHLYEDDDGFHNAPPSRRSPPRPIVQTRTIKNLPPDSGLCVQIPTVIKSTAGFRHFSRSIQAQSEMEKLYFILAGKPLGSDKRVVYNSKLMLLVCVQSSRKLLRTSAHQMCVSARWHPHLT